MLLRDFLSVLCLMHRASSIISTPVMLLKNWHKLGPWSIKSWDISWPRLSPMNYISNMLSQISNYAKRNCKLCNSHFTCRMKRKGLNSLGNWRKFSLLIRCICNYASAKTLTYSTVGILGCSSKWTSVSSKQFVKCICSATESAVFLILATVLDAQVATHYAIFLHFNENMKHCAILIILLAILSIQLSSTSCLLYVILLPIEGAHAASPPTPQCNWVYRADHASSSEADL